jgi:protein gp37
MNDVAIPDQTRRLKELELVIERGLKTFTQVGTALLEIRETRLWALEHRTFASYCSDRWGMTKQRAHQLMDGCEFRKAIENGSQESTAVDDDVPEGALRPLSQVPKEARAMVWEDAVAHADGKQPTAKMVQEAVDRYVAPVTTEPASSTEPSPPEKKFNQTNEMVDWARWTWNPVTGCEHTCVYCYARDIANRFYPEKFEPTFRPERLDAPRNTKMPGEAKSETDPVKAMGWRNCFVCSMADLFGRWVPDQWIEDVFVSCRQSPEWNYLFLTKFPQRYVGLEFPETAWIGTTVDEQKRVANAEKAFERIDVPVKWLSVEPMLEQLTFKSLKMFDWVVIGGQSRSSGAPEFHPDPWWVIDFAFKARDAGCKVYMKPNTFSGTGWQIKEYPY